MTAGSIDTSSDLSEVATDVLDDAVPPSMQGEPTHLTYLPGLDGLRALAVLAVMSGHLPYASTIRPDWLNGSWLGVSTFFTLSGFLITRLLLAERKRTGAVSLGGFWTRRVKRLLPALYTCIAFMLLLSVLDIAPADTSLGDQVLALVLYFKNGLLLYLDGPNGPTFFQMWSLSIEEQFYLVFPLLFLGLSTWLRRRAWIVFGVLLVAAQLLMISVSSQGTFDGYVTAYFSTPTRSAEILAGVLLAYATTSAWWRRAVTKQAFHLACRVVGVAGLIGLLWLFRIADVSWDLTHRWTMWTSVATVAIIVGCTTSGGAASVLAWRPLRWVGKVSYGAYLYHLGVFFVLTAGRTGIASDFGLSVVRYAATFVVAGLSFRYIESPLRHRATPAGWRLAVSYGAVGAVLVGAAYTLPLNEVPALPTSIQAAGPFAATNAHAGFDATRVAVVTDPRTERTLSGLASITEASAGGYHVKQRTLAACPMTGSGTLVVDGQLRNTIPSCTYWHAAGGLGKPRSEVTIVAMGGADLLDRRIGEGEIVHLGQAAADQRARAWLRRLAAAAEMQDAAVVWAELPDDPGEILPVRRSDTIPGTPVTADEERQAAELGTPTEDEMRARIERFNELLHEVGDESSAVTVVEPVDATASSWREALDDGSQGGS